MREETSLWEMLLCLVGSCSDGVKLARAPARVVCAAFRKEALTTKIHNSPLSPANAEQNIYIGKVSNGSLHWYCKIMESLHLRMVANLCDDTVYTWWKGIKTSQSMRWGEHTRSKIWSEHDGLLRYSNASIAESNLFLSVFRPRRRS